MSNKILRVINTYKWSLLTIGLVAAMSMFILKQNNHSDDHVRFVNLHDAVSIPVALLSKTELSKDKQQEILKRYTRNLLPIIKQYAKNNQVTVINSNIVADEYALDITNEIIKMNLKEVSK